MKLGLQLGYWPSRPPSPSSILELGQEAERLGYDAIFTAEAYGSDVFTPLAFLAGHTKKIRLGTGIAQISARTPASTAMHAITLDHLSGGRVMLGLGVSGPQVVEGWYGQPFSKPLARTREYVDILRQIFRRAEPVKNDGEHYPLPYRGPGSWELGKSLRSITAPLRSDLPILLGAEGPKNVALAAEICDGWLPLYYSPFRQEIYAESLGELPPGFEIPYGIRVEVTDDIPSALAPIKQNLSFYVGGMGAKKRNFHRELMARLGWEAESFEIQERFLAGDRKGAAAAVPDEFADEISLVGTAERIHDRLAAWKESPVTMLMVGTAEPSNLRQIAELVLG